MVIDGPQRGIRKIVRKLLDEGGLFVANQDRSHAFGTGSH